MRSKSARKATHNGSDLRNSSVVAQRVLVLALVKEVVINEVRVPNVDARLPIVVLFSRELP